jgi:UMP-CMP kinase
MLFGYIGTSVYKTEFTGGPGVGKGTQCTRLAQDLDLVHISVGDLLRIEKEGGKPEFRELIEMHMRGGTIVPTRITMAILKAAIIRHVESDKRRFLVDGFPRHMEQALAFEKAVSHPISSLLKNSI